MRTFSIVTLIFAGLGSNSLADSSKNNSPPALKISGHVDTLEELEKQAPADFYEIESKKNELIYKVAQEKFLEDYWNRKAVELKRSGRITHGL